MALFGLSLLTPQFQIFTEKMFTKLSSRMPQGKKQGNGFWSGILLGISLGLVWTPCVGPIIASVITLAAANSVNASDILITFAYAIGTAIPMLAITYGGRTLLLKVPWLLKNTATIQKAFGVIMILVAIGIFLNFDRQFETYIITKFPQYGAGLTRLEDNSYVRKGLLDIKNNKNKNLLQNTIDNLGQTIYPKAPEITAGGEWFNTKPLSIKKLRGKVVLVDFWTYTCINCIRTLPYIKAWNEKYKDLGLVIIGVHTPEFEFEKNAQNVAKAISDFKITYPVMQDNDYATWNAYNNQYWPADYLIDKNGKIRDTHFGEGDYDKTEKMIQILLKETGATVKAKVNNPTYTIDALSPETYLGYERLGNFVSIESPVNDMVSHYSIPTALPLNSFAFGGNWNIGAQTTIPTTHAVLEYHFKAKDVYLVLNSKNGTAKFNVFLDGEKIGSEDAGNDVTEGSVNVTENRLYHLVHLKKAEDHTLRLKFLDNNASVFAFTFG